jgi:hypothetical protein
MAGIDGAEQARLTASEPDSLFSCCDELTRWLIGVSFQRLTKNLNLARGALIGQSKKNVALMWASFSTETTSCVYAPSHWATAEPGHSSTRKRMPAF